MFITLVRAATKSLTNFFFESAQGEWIKTIPGKGWFTYFRIYGPEAAAFDGSWKPADFEEVK